MDRIIVCLCHCSEWSGPQVCKLGRGEHNGFWAVEFSTKSKQPAVTYVHSVRLSAVIAFLKNYYFRFEIHTSLSCLLLGKIKPYSLFMHVIPLQGLGRETIPATADPIFVVTSMVTVATMPPTSQHVHQSKYASLLRLKVDNSSCILLYN